jgi:hypothetical protein
MDTILELGESRPFSKGGRGKAKGNNTKEYRLLTLRCAEILSEKESKTSYRSVRSIPDFQINDL